MQYMKAKSCLIIILILLLAIPATPKAQSYQNQPTVKISESQPIITYNSFSGTFNLTISGYIMVNNTDSSNTLYDINLSYQPLPSQFSIQQVGAYYINQTGPHSRPNNNIITSQRLIHINEIPPNGAFQVLYIITGTNLQASQNQTIPGTNMPNIANVTEHVYFMSQFDPTAQWIEQNFTYNPDINNFTIANPLSVGDLVRVYVTLTNVDSSAPISNIRFKKQLPFGNDTTGNATGHVYNFSYWSGTIPYQNLTGIQPDPATGIANFTVLQSLPPGDTLYVAFDAYLTRINGTELPPGSGTRYITICPAYFEFTQTKAGASYLGSYIDTGSQNWISAGGNTNVSITKGFDALSNKWQFRVQLYNPTDTSFNVTSLKVLRNNNGTTPDIKTAALVWSTSGISLEPGTSYDSSFILDTLYMGSNTQPPVYWVSYVLDIYPLIVGSPTNYQQNIDITAGAHANITVPEAFLRLSQWQVKVTKMVTFNDADGRYLINITATNIGFSNTPGWTRLYDYIPQNFSASGFRKSNDTMPDAPYLPDYNVVSEPVTGPRTIGWNLYVMRTGDYTNFSYIAEGTGALYSSSEMYVIGADPMNVMGAIAGGYSALRTSIGGLPVELAMATAAVLILTIGLLRRMRLR